MVIDVKKGIMFQVKLWILLFCIFLRLEQTFFRRKQFAMIAKMQRRPGWRESSFAAGKFCPLAPSLPCGPPVPDFCMLPSGLASYPTLYQGKDEGKKGKGGGEFLLGKIATASRKNSLRKLKKIQGPEPSESFISLKWSATLPLVIAGWHNNDPCFPSAMGIIRV